MSKDDSSDAGARQSLGEVHGSVPLPRQVGFWRRMFAFVGPAYLISVGYMDPGNWATDIAAGAQFGYALIWVLLLSNLMAILLQGLAARLGIVTGMDLAQACRAMYGRRSSVVLWLLCELAIAATDLAEVLGSAIGLQLLFGLPLLAGVFVTALDSFLLLLLHHKGVRTLEAVIVVLVTTIGACMGVEIFLARPDWVAVAAGFVPSLPGDGALYLAVGIIGATVMPHNLYLHSALVQSRRIVHTPTGIRTGVRFNLLDSAVALNLAFLVNAALLIMAAATFHGSGHNQVGSLQEAHHLLEPILGASLAPLVFAIALIAAGQSSTITGTLAGQVVMEGFVRLRLRPLARRMLTRAAAIVPAVLVLSLAGDQASGRLLIFSQVLLSLQLSFAVIPLVHLVSDPRWMGQHALRPWLQGLAWLVALVIGGLNVWLAQAEVVGWVAAAGSWGWLVGLVAGAGALGLLAFLGYIALVPLVARARKAPTPVFQGVHGPNEVPEVRPAPAPRHVAAAVDFSAADAAVLSHAVSLARAAGRGGKVTLLHVVESSGARLLGAEMADGEARADQERLELYRLELGEQGVEAAFDLGFGDPVDQLVLLCERVRPDLVVVGGHGHGLVGDLLRGTTADRLRHRLRIPVLVLPACVVDRQGCLES